MKRLGIAVAAATLLVATGGVSHPDELRGGVSAAQLPSLGDPAQLKRTLLERMTREPATYRGDNNIRLKWEWYDWISQRCLLRRLQRLIWHGKQL